MQIRIPALMLMLATASIASGCITADDPSAGDPEAPASGDEAAGNATANTTVEEILSTQVSWTLGATGCLSAAVAIMLPALESVDFASVAIPADAHDAGFNATLTSATEPVEWGIAFWAGDAIAGTYYSMEDRVDGTVPAGSDTAQFFSCAGAELNATFTVAA